MKLRLIALAGLLLCGAAFAQEKVEKWGTFEVSLPATVKSNPFDVELTATFKGPEGSVTVNGFYDGDNTFKVRFMPSAEGTYTYTTKSKVGALNGKKGSFVATAPSEGNHGPVHPFGTNFKYSDGGWYYPVGTTAYDWMHVRGDYPERTIKSMKAAGFNKMRCLVMLHNLKDDITEPTVYPFEANEDGSWDFSRFDPAYFQLVERRVKALQEIGVEAELVLFHPYDRWGFNRMPYEVNTRYLKYMTARLASFRNVWWSLANEFDGVRGIPRTDWDRFAQTLRDTDPYRHPVSIHGYTSTYYENTFKDLYTHASIQDQAPVEDFGRAVIVKNIYHKPVVFDEVCYEGNMTSRWGCLSAQEELHRMWQGLMVGTYVTHAECYVTDGTEGMLHDYLAVGGDFVGESWKRVNFIHEVLADLPKPLDLADTSWDPHVSSAGDGYYMIYTGKNISPEWRFNLPVKNRTGSHTLREGTKFKVEIIDTWNMTIEEYPETFEMGKPSQYRIEDKLGRSVRLPELPYLIIRLKEIE